MLRKFYILTFNFILASSQLYELNILHYNDFHARFVETNAWGGTCADPDDGTCIGGFARLATAIREGLDREPESLVLNAGDSFQGTIWYNLLRWNVTQEFMNMVPHDAHVLGNHEFDNGIEGVVPYLQYLEAKVVTANIIDDLEPTIQGLYEPSIVVEKTGRRIGIIGVIIATTHELASTGELVFTDEVEAVRREAEKLNEEGVDIIVVLSHCGIEIDEEIALHGGPYIDIVVGGHSHTLMYSGTPPSGANPIGPYPTVIEQEGGRPVPIVQAYCHTEYLGEIKLLFDDNGILQEWSGQPRHLGNDVEQAPDVLEKLAVYIPEIDTLAKQEVGSTLVQLSSSCACEECNLGSFICDAFMHGVMDKAEPGHWHFAHLCLINQGGIRSAIQTGNITYEDVILTTPFENMVEVFELRGEHILETLEYSLSNEPYLGARMLQIAGLRGKYNGTAPIGSRVREALVRCIDCDVPRYEPIQPDLYYRVVSQSFLGAGGDGFTAISNNRINLQVIGVDNVILQDYIKHVSPILQDLDGRIDIYEPCIA